MKNYRAQSTVRRPGAFSLIELLTVMVIIAILGAVAAPGFQSAIVKARQSRSVQHARQIVLGLRLHAQDYDGRFPTYENVYGQEIESSNDAFRGLVPDYVDNEKIFSITGSAWGPDADGRIDGADEILQPGENHFAYITGLHTGARSYWPLVVDGTDGGSTYSNLEGEKGGIWGGKHAIVVYVDGSSRAARLKHDGDKRFLPRHDNEDLNALDLADYMPESARLLNPAE